MSAHLIELPHRNFMERLVIYWESRDIGKKANEMVDLFAVAIFFDRQIYAEELEVAEKILARYVKNAHTRNVIMERIKIKLDEYVHDYFKFLLDREHAFDILTENIQLYAAMKDIFEADGELSEREVEAEDVIKKEYDKHWKQKAAYRFKADSREWSKSGE